MKKTVKPSNNPITKLETYKKYLHLIGAVPTYQLEKSIACGLPTVWLYMKSLGLEEAFFDILNKIKTRALLFKELFYLLILTNGQNKYFPHIAKDFLKIELPKDIQAAQINIDKPNFELAYSFTKQQLQETITAIAKPNVMIRLGNEHKAVGIMYSNDMYHVYHIDNPAVLQFKTLDKCVELIMRVMNHG